MVFNTTFGAESIADSFSIRRTTLMNNVAYYTTVAGMCGGRRDPGHAAGKLLTLHRCRSIIPKRPEHQLRVRCFFDRHATVRAGLSRPNDFIGTEGRMKHVTDHTDDPEGLSGSRKNSSA